MSQVNVKSIEIDELKQQILNRFSQYLKDGQMDYTENLSAQLDLYAKVYAAKFSPNVTEEMIREFLRNDERVIRTEIQDQLCKLIQRFILKNK